VLLAALLAMGAAAPPPAVPLNDAAQHDDIAPRVRALLSDANGVWSQQFTALGSQYPAAGITFFSQTIRKACGVESALTGTFYCPDERKIYFDQSAGFPDDLAIAFVVGHAMGHHAQSLMGTTPLVAQARSRSSPAVAARTWMVAELQADCYAGIWLGSAIKRGVIHPGRALSAVLDAAAAASQSANAHLPPGAQAPDPMLTYGTAPQRLAWVQRGIDSGGINQCDTFGAEASGKL
jgi:uncharacterized protein